ncbi:54S ribosomal protein L16, mitochondrial [Sphaceloma murrayae]|uniref:54S ribosomal protein L16, mitochondrial n=1 Tax=Sphaceloma murrayae TaxID=2082308 RepID=A0A2K1QP79_9PEZI|nr:54S ribosomal protein L16, mitochondrial [Sphaceloma murrayae]
MRTSSTGTLMSSLTHSLQSLSVQVPGATVCSRCRPLLPSAQPSLLPNVRPFSSTSHFQNWLAPRSGKSGKDKKGRPRVPTGGSMRGTTVVWGDYGLRLLDHDRRISAAQLRNGEEAIKKRLRGLKYRMYTRISADIGVYMSGNETRMGKGKGSFDHWASRVAISKIIFELQGEVHEQVVKDAFRLAGNKMPGQYEFVKKGDPPVMGIAKVTSPMVEQELRNPRQPLPKPNLENTANRLSSGKMPIPPIDPTIPSASTTQPQQRA